MKLRWRNFLKLKGQAVLLRADTYTGHVLDEFYNVARNENQKVYTVFETVQEALDLAKSILVEKNNQVECTIYNQNQELLHNLNPFQK